MSNKVRKCHCCMSPAGGFDDSFKQIHGQRLVTLYGKTFYQYFCKEHCDRAAEIIYKDLNPVAVLAVDYEAKLLEAIAQLDKNQRYYSNKQLREAAEIPYKAYYQTGLSKIGLKASNRSKEVEFEARIKEAIARLESAGRKRLKICDILLASGVSWNVYRERPKLKLLVERAIVRSGAEVRRTRGGRPRKVA